VNNFLHSLFSQVDVSLNGTMITSSTNTYAYRAYIETLLSYDNDATSSRLTFALFYKDEAGKMDEPYPLAPDDDKNSGLVKRQTFAAMSSEIDMIGRIHSDIFFQERYTLNEVNVKIKLIRSNDAFCLMSIGETQFKVVVTFASLLIRKVKISPSVYLAHAKTLESGTAKYPIRRVISPICRLVHDAGRPTQTASLFLPVNSSVLVAGLSRSPAPLSGMICPLISCQLHHCRFFGKN
jgi:hypothetical protein